MSVIQVNKISHLQGLLDKEEQSYLSLKLQRDRINDQMDYHADKIKWYKVQLENIRLSK